MADNKYLLLLIGSYAAGKTSFIERFVNGKCLKEFKTTNGIQFVETKKKINNNICEISFLDSSGKEEYQPIINNYIKAADGLIFFFDLTNKNSLNFLEKRINSIENIIKGIPAIIIGTKSDLKHKLKEKIKFNYFYYEVSIYDKNNFENPISCLLNEINKKRIENKECQCSIY